MKKILWCAANAKIIPVHLNRELVFVILFHLLQFTNSCHCLVQTFLFRNISSLSSRQNIPRTWRNSANTGITNICRYQTVTYLVKRCEVVNEMLIFFLFISSGNIVKTVVSCINVTVRLVCGRVWSSWETDGHFIYLDQAVTVIHSQRLVVDRKMRGVDSNRPYLLFQVKNIGLQNSFSIGKKATLCICSEFLHQTPVKTISAYYSNANK